MNYEQEQKGMDPLRAVRPYLYSGEEVLWTGHPYRSVPYRIPVAGAVFSIFWLGFAVFWTVSASAVGGAFGLFGLPFIGVGCILVYSMTIGERKKLRRTVYAVTDRRAIILTMDSRGTNCHEYLLSNLSGISLESVQGDVGTIRLVPKEIYYDHRGRRKNATPDLTTAFLMIDNVQSVYRIICEHRGEE